MAEHDDRHGTGIAIVGMSGRFPGAPDLAAFWRNLCAGAESIAFFEDSELAEAGVSEAEYSRPDYVKAGARAEGIDLFDAEFFGYTPREAMIMDPQHRVFLETAWEALENAGYDPGDIGAGVGVFGGASTSAYLGNIFANLDRGAAIGASNVGIGNELGFLTTRVSYKLNLRGPSVPVHTACSSSLVAVHLAVQSLLGYECDMALAGGVAFKVPPGAGYRAQTGGILSPDGHCRPFDAKSNGTVFNNGVGVVVLKRLGEAQAANDTVYAVIKGSAVNNDGSVKASFTAPGVSGQAGVVLEAFTLAGVDADSVGYIEAHGSGTAIGDSIEIEALTRAFGESAADGSTPRCAIGSVKSNIGHLDAAAGIAGLLKTTLALHHRMLPPTAHFHAPNPSIDFARTPFNVQSELTEWDSPDRPRRAGVSAFGFGGTNAHVVLEQAPEPGPSASARRSHLLVISARTPRALNEATQRLVAHLRQESPSIADVAYTLAVGRRAFAHRRMLVVADVPAAVAALTNLDEDIVHTAEIAAEPPAVIFRFDSSSSDQQGARETAELLCSWGITPRSDGDASGPGAMVIDVEPGDLADAQRTLGWLWLAGVPPDWSAYHREEQVRRVPLPTYPFERERYWLDQPSAQVRAAQESTVDGPHPLLDELLVHGMDEVVFRTGFAVDRQWVLNEHLMVSEAVVPGTTYLEMARAAGEVFLGSSVTALTNVEFLVPLVVGAGETRVAHTTVRRTGADELEFTVASRADEGGWTLHVRGRLDDWPCPAAPPASVDEMRARCGLASVDVGKLQAEHLLMEFGSRWRDSLSTVDVGERAALGYLELPSRYADEIGTYVLHPALLDLATGFHRWAMLDANIDQATAAANQDFYLPLAYDRLVVHRPMPADCVSFIRPAAGFEQSDELRKADVLVIGRDGGVVLDIRGFTAKRVSDPHRAIRNATSGAVHHTLRWVDAPRDHGEIRTADEILVVGASDLAASLVTALRERGITVAQADSATEWASLPDDILYVADGAANEYTLDCQGELADRGVFNLFRLVQALAEQESRSRRITVVAACVNSVTGAEARLVPVHAALFGLAKVVWQENPEITCRCLDVDMDTSAEAVLREVFDDDPFGQVALRGGNRFVAELAEADLADGPLPDTGVYLITGGLGGLGREAAHYLSSAQPAPHIAIVGRNAPPPPEEWPALRDKTGKQAAQVRALEAIAARGTRVRCYQGDVSSLDDMRRVTAAVRADLGRITGIIHAAGAAGDGFILRKSEEVFRATLAPKVSGALVLDTVTRDDAPEVMVLFSSTTALFGATGQSDYTAANLYLDAFAAWRNRQGRRTITVNWTDWLDTGMAADHNVQPDQGFFRSITIEDAVASLDAILRARCPQVIVGKINYTMLDTLDRAVLSGLISRAPVRLSETVRQALTRSPQRKLRAGGLPPVADITLDGRPGGAYGSVERELAGIWAAELGLSELNVFATLFDLGGDSLIALRLANSIQQTMGIKVTMAEIFANPTVAQLAEHLDRTARAEPVEVATTKDDGTGWFELWNVQRGMWLQHQLDENRAELNLPMWQEVRFAVDVDAFRQAISMLVDRHHALRLVFKDTPTGPRQSLLASHTVDVPLIDLASTVNRAADPAAELAGLIRADALLPFGDLDTPPVRAKLYRLGDEHYCVYLCVHHIVSDGTSMGILLRELRAAYEAIVSGERPRLDPLDTTYDEYVRTRRQWLDSAESAKMERYWRGELVWPVPRLRLGDYEAPAADVANESQEFRIDAELTAALTETAHTLDVTMHILLLAAYFAVLHDITTDEDIVVGVPFSGRDTKELEKLVGLFINTLSVRIQLSSADTFAGLVATTKRKSLDAYANGRYPCIDLVERLKADRPELTAIFTTAFQFTDFLPPADQTAQLNICLNGRRHGDEIELRFSYNPKRLSRSEVVDIQVSLLAVLSHIRCDPAVTLSELAGPMEQARRAAAANASGGRSRLQSLISAGRGRGWAW